MAFVHRSKDSSLDLQVKGLNSLGPGQYIPLKEYVSPSNLYSFNSNEVRFKKNKPEDFFLPGPASYFTEKSPKSINVNEIQESIKIVNTKNSRLIDKVKDKSYIESKHLFIK
jgi:hypothetical protein